jgi:AcrR family transcriptional regulator
VLRRVRTRRSLRRDYILCKVKHEHYFLSTSGPECPASVGAWGSSRWAGVGSIDPDLYSYAMATSEPLIRPPQQRRSQESLERLLVSGFEVLQEQGFDGFTLQEVSHRAGVSIGSIYARVPNREALIMAIYERHMAWTAEEETRQLELARSLEGSSPEERVRALVQSEVMTMLAYADTLRVFMRGASTFPEIWERGALKSQANAKSFRQAMLGVREHIDHPDPELAVDIAWRMIYCTVARRITHGPRFESRRPVSEKQLTVELSRAVAKYLL